jgi:hypothetical protein
MGFKVILGVSYGKSQERIVWLYRFQEAFGSSSQFLEYKIVSISSIAVFLLANCFLVY